MAKLKCPKCFHVNPEGQEVCINCRTPLPKIRIEARTDPTPPPEASEIQFRRGQVVAQRYTVLRLIGRGGMGCIYKVHDNTLGEEVALKTLLPQLARDQLVVERFFNEARIARRLAHPNIVRVHDIGTAGNIIYISMEFVEGISLRQSLERQRPDTPLPLLQVLTIMDELCAALEYAHQFTVHRDIKPENVMLSSDGRVKLMDFGISKLMADTRLTGASVVMGTPFYMAPEQLRNSRDVDARADVYSVGVMMYELLTGNVPTGVPKAVSEIMKAVPPELDAVIGRCVEPDPKNRFQNATELRQAIAPLRQALQTGGRLKTGRRTAGAGGGGGRLRRPLGAALAALLLAATAFGVYRAEMSARGLAPEQEETSAAPEGTAERYDLLAPLVLRAREAADTRSQRVEGALRKAYDAGEEVWQTAQQRNEADGAEAARLAECALQCYLACLMWPKEMVFIPPGETEVNGARVTVPPFFIDETEVTAGKYREFCERAPGGWVNPLPQDYAPDWPAVLVAYYDAQAYAAANQKLLPTEAQWARAAYGNIPADYPWGNSWEEGAAKTLGTGDAGMPATVKSYGKDLSRYGCWDMAGNVTEWTRSPFAPKDEAQPGGTPDFGVPMAVRGGHYNAAAVRLTDSFAASYEKRDPTLGFRCVLEIPTRRDIVESILDKA
ncbi:MAG: SUMF1/EgtB/PvdO family nonheme iron enzyme [Candidatus Hydrogenedentes bacterium]|nr:SUMF1/EgtB/PvdO family nonheme iron enzyme [Candidatus Hydrogenedentota bacterium]